MLAFDIETCPLDDETVLQFADPFEPSPHPGQFDETKVAYGNTKDPAKRAEKLKDCQEKHAAAVASYEADMAKAREEWRAKVLEKAALDAATGRVLVIGAMNAASGVGGMGKHGTPEGDVLQAFWEKYKKCRMANRQMVGFDIRNFDLPFMRIRSAILGVDVPRSVFDGKRFDPLFVDLAEDWACGRRWSDVGKFKLDRVAMALGVGRKWPGECCGRVFHKFWNGTPEQHAEAQAYLLRDLELVVGVAKKLGVIL
jgi:uncharacterized protein YprB with RNaseH-like and TPR domain